VNWSSRLVDGRLAGPAKDITKVRVHWNSSLLNVTSHSIPIAFRHLKSFWKFILYH